MGLAARACALPPRGRAASNQAFPLASRLPYGFRCADPTFALFSLCLWSTALPAPVPATLILFFVQDRLQATEATQPLFLGSYFVCAALTLPLWLLLVRRVGLARTWLLGMVLAIVTFAGAAHVGRGRHSGVRAWSARCRASPWVAIWRFPARCWQA